MSDSSKKEGLQLILWLSQIVARKLSQTCLGQSQKSIPTMCLTLRIEKLLSLLLTYHLIFLYFNLRFEIHF